MDNENVINLEYKEVFLEEANEQIQILNMNILSLEQNPEDEKTIQSVFRIVHTFKSSAAFVGLSELSHFCHSLENLLSKIVKKIAKINTDVVDTLFSSFDKIKIAIDEFSDTNQVTVDFSDNLAQILSLVEQDSNASAQKIEQSSSKSSETTAVKQHTTDISNSSISNLKITNKVYEEAEHLAESTGQSLYIITVEISRDAQMKWLRGELILSHLDSIGKVLTSYPEVGNFRNSDFDNSVVALLCTDAEENKIHSEADIDQITKIAIEHISIDNLDARRMLDSAANVIKSSQDENGKSDDSIENTQKHDTLKADANKNSEADLKQKDMIAMGGKLTQTVRVTISKLDELLNWVGELAIVSSGFLDLTDQIKHRIKDMQIVAEMTNKVDNLARIARNLQEGIMQSRMVPVSFVFSRFHRIVRDISKELNKQVNLIIHGEETELDKKIVDAISEPLIHVIRNALDHGVEAPEERRRKNKPEVGTIYLDSYQMGNRIYIEVKDDGKGLDREKIIKTAVKRNLLTEDSAQNLSDSDVYNIIFLPGFSTKDEVTEISGRGVGMGVIQETVHKLNGNINILSTIDAGTTFILSFPLTLAIVPALMIEEQTEVFAIPLTNVVEAISVKTDQLETVDRHLILNLRQQVIPLFRLSEILANEIKTNEKNSVNIVIVEYEGNQLGVIIEKLIGKREIVIKALHTNYAEIEGISGAAILGNGKIALILDIGTLVKKQKVMSLHKRISNYAK